MQHHHIMNNALIEHLLRSPFVSPLAILPPWTQCGVTTCLHLKFVNIFNAHMSFFHYTTNDSSTNEQKKEIIIKNTN